MVHEQKYPFGKGGSLNRFVRSLFQFIFNWIIFQCFFKETFEEFMDVEAATS